MNNHKAVSRRKPDYFPHDPLLSAREAAAEVGIGLSTLWRDLRSGAFPPPYRVTPRNPRWRRSELHSWIASCRAGKGEA